MSYQEADGKIILTMSKADYRFLFGKLGLVIGSRIQTPAETKKWAGLLNRLNEGNSQPNYYAIPTYTDGEAELNQFGEAMAYPIPVVIEGQAWRCSECKALSYGTDGNPPQRCSNRETCGRLFHKAKLKQEKEK